MATSIKPKALTAEEIAELEHSFIGPTWAKDEDGNWDLPELTLGWEIAMWCSKWLRGMDGKPWKFTPEQLRFVLWWYAIDASGRFVYRTGVLQRMKGWGKDPLLAVISLVEFVGPSRIQQKVFGVPELHASGPLAGQPKGVAHPQAWVQITAVSQTQTTNTMAMFPILMSEEFIAHFAINPGAELIRAHGGKQRLEAVTSSYRAIEGKRTTFTLKNETHHWVTGNDGHKMAETIDGNSTKMSSRWLSITNAYLPGEDSVAEREREAWQKVQDGRAHDMRMLYDSIEAHPMTPLSPEALGIVIPIIRGDAVWLNVEDITMSVLNTQIAPSRSRRMYLNQIVAEEDAIYGPEQWVPLEVEGAVLQADDEIVLGFDGGKSDDATCLVAIRISDKVSFLLLCEERPDSWPTGDGAPRWQVNRDRVDSAVHDAFRIYKVKGFYADVALWESYIDDWAETYRKDLVTKASERHAVAWDMRQSAQRVTRAHERLMQTIFDGKLFHDGDADLKRHVLNARRRTNNYGVSFGKESRESPRKVDAYAALMLAHEALHDLRTRGKQQKQRTGRGYFM
jgi:phage terminase large subunit-like protein